MPKTKDPPSGSDGGLSRRTLLGSDALFSSTKEHKKQDVDGRIIVDAKARESQKALYFKWNLRDLYEPMRDECGFDKPMVAAAIALGHSGAWTSYSRNRNWYPGKASRYHDGLMTYANVVGAMDRLDAAGLINHAKAAPGARGWQSAAQAKPELIRRVHDIMHGRPRLVLAPPRETIILRDVDGDNIEYRDTREHDRARRFVESMNEALAATNIPMGAAAPMTRIYNLDFKRGGRFYAVGGGWQSLPKAVRKAVTIDGEEVVELDYSALHPSILYAHVGHPMPSGGCYEVGRWPRKLAKVALLTMLNAKDKATARCSIAHNSVIELVESVDERGKPKAFKAAAGVMTSLERLHQPIASYFYADAGAWLMSVDSAIAEAVMKAMLKQNIVVLPVHDSFLVQKLKASKLEAAMMDAAYQIAKLHAKIKVA